MGKKTKVGKQRKDRFYQLAKETGYRSRASFKLIQLNRKFEFLQKSRVAIDLCAAPGGWLQVCQKYMPVSSIIVGVDLVSIRAIHNVITLQEDITTSKCRKAIEKELKTWKADLVLNDGAPNVGKNWLHDSFTQSRLALSALQLASAFLMKGGTFVTKVFRSKDYNALMWVLSKLFRKVCATKPQASRNESAEIFVVCQGYLAPDKIDPKFFDPCFLFEETDTVTDERKMKANLLKPVHLQKKAKAEGYREGDLTCFTSLKASEFIKNGGHIEMMSQASEIVVDTDDISNHPLTTDELKECLKDLKVLGRKELLMVINWRRKLKEQLYKEEKKEKVGEDVEAIAEEEEEEIVDNSLKRKKKKILKERKKLNERMNLKMIIKNDQLIEEDDGELFKLSLLRNKNQIENFEEFSMSEESDVEEEAVSSKVNYDRDDGHHQIEDDDEDEDAEKKKDPETVDASLSDDEEDNGKVADDDDSDAENDGLITDLGTNLSRDEKRNLFFKRGIFEEEKFNDSDEEMVLGLDDGDSRTKSRRNQKKKNKSRASDGETEEDSDDYYTDSEDSDVDLRPKRKHSKAQLDVKLDPESLALGEMMIKSRKAKRDLLDDGWNRYTRSDENVPSWFRKDEEKHFRKPLPVDEAVVSEYRNRAREINVRPIKKIAEAKARKKKRALMKMEKARKRAETITGAADMSESEKTSHLKNLYKKALKGNSSKKKEVTYVVAKKGRANQRPKGVKGKYKVVDARMRKDQRNKTLLDKKGSKGGRGGGGGKGGSRGTGRPPKASKKARAGGAGNR